MQSWLDFIDVYLNFLFWIPPPHDGQFYLKLRTEPYLQVQNIAEVCVTKDNFC